ncbi:hypothetical protein M4V62_05240 [Streptomyces durmitorensis]|uniref:NACHT N-terminal Helical domain-containing protein n=1 Tax=Streptomyces durmitorensis TaxID=319947 RepID=A0ABY4PNV0_9ACTN|nr:hypothetical protein [Streptomyces durmitorensis]UQT54549.1 hypothetical protein M4V62_05240 [Streptomyces durmitorensis]
MMDTLAVPSRSWEGAGVQGMSYADAVRLLGGAQSPALAALDRLTGGALLMATGGGSALALSLFDARG